jgi:hypothetical protein
VWEDTPVRGTCTSSVWQGMARYHPWTMSQIERTLIEDLREPPALSLSDSVCRTCLPVRVLLPVFFMIVTFVHLVSFSLSLSLLAPPLLCPTRIRLVFFQRFTLLRRSLFSAPNAFVCRVRARPTSLAGRHLWSWSAQRQHMRQDRHLSCGKSSLRK